MKTLKEDSKPDCFIENKINRNYNELMKQDQQLTLL